MGGYIISDIFSQESSKSRWSHRPATVLVLGQHWRSWKGSQCGVRTSMEETMWPTGRKWPMHRWLRIFLSASSAPRSPRPESGPGGQAARIGSHLGCPPCYLKNSGNSLDLGFLFCIWETIIGPSLGNLKIQLHHKIRQIGLSYLNSLPLLSCSFPHSEWSTSGSGNNKQNRWHCMQVLSNVTDVN